MEEDEYKSTYKELTSVRCVFEKALVNHQVDHPIKCSLSKHFCLADREGYFCESVECSVKCSELLKNIRKNSIFVLKLREINGPLPHNMEIRVQVGGVTGLAKLLEIDYEDPEQQTTIDDISQLLKKVQEKYGTFDNLPYSKIIQSVLQFQGRSRRKTR